MKLIRVWKRSVVSLVMLLALSVGACGGGGGQHADAGPACGASGQPCCLNKACGPRLSCSPENLCLGPGGSDGGPGDTGPGPNDGGPVAGDAAPDKGDASPGTDGGGPAPGDTGKRCATGSECASGVCIDIVGLTTDRCTTTCTGSAQCLPGWSCGPVAGQSKSVCTCTKSDEICDGKDNDCDGQVDEPGATDELCQEAVGEGGTCRAGACACGGAMCGGTCVNTQSNPAHCGGCDMPCAGPCSAGKCAQVRQLSAGYNGTCAALSDGTVRCWGSYTSIITARIPETIEGAVKVSSVSVGENHVCGVTTESGVLCWGSNDGRLGDGMTDYRAEATPVVGISNATQIAAGYESTFVRKADATVAEWGLIPDASGTSLKTLVPQPITELSAVAQVTQPVPGGPACVRHTNGTVSCWGLTWHLVDGLTGVRQLGGQGRCALMNDGSVRCKPDSSFFDPWLPVAGISNATQIADGDEHSCVVTSEKTVKCWGNNSTGQLGSGDALGTTAVVTVPGLTTAVEVAAGRGHSCARLEDGTVRCWGYNDGGQIGDGTATMRLAPTPPRW